MGSHNTFASKKRPLSATQQQDSNNNGDESKKSKQPEPLYLEEGLFAVEKPIGWTSQDVVGKLRRILEKDAKERGAPDHRKKRRKPWMKIGHGGTLDPLATGVLVCGIGKGTKSLQKYLVGSKQYRAEVTLGFQTTTLDQDPNGSVVEEKPFDHVTSEDTIRELLQSQFTGNIQQIPPVFSALKRNGKKLYELGREGKTAEDLQIEPREVMIYDLQLVSCERKESNDSSSPIQSFVIDVECGGGTYIRSLTRDIGIALGTVATMTKLERTKQGQFLTKHVLPPTTLENGEGKDEIDLHLDSKNDKQNCDNWTPSTISNAIRMCREKVLVFEDDGLRKD